MFGEPVRILLLLAGIILFSQVSGQHEKLSSQSKKALKAYEKGTEYYTNRQYFRAAEEFTTAIREDSMFFEAYLILGDLYENMQKEDEAIAMYRKATAISPGLFPSVYYLLANLEIKHEYYREALEHLGILLDYKTIPEEIRLKAAKKKRDLEFTIEAVKNPVSFVPVNLGDSINTEYDEYFPNFTADNEYLLFTRLLEDKDTKLWKNEDFFYSRKSTGKWGRAINMGPPVNSRENEGAPSLSPDGNTLIFTACAGLGGYGGNRLGYGRCDLFITRRNGDLWTFPENLETPVNSKFWESQPSIASDGKTLYFISNREGGYDIWQTVKDEEGTWSEPLKLGPEINTPGYEGSVFIHPDNQTLYFVSDGHPGMGGHDVFMTRRNERGNWGSPVNLGFPINSPGDEDGFIVSADGRSGYFSSNRPGGFGGLDLYFFELYEEARPLPVTYMKGIVYDSETKLRLEARFELIDLVSGETVVTSFSNAGNGEFLVCLPTEKDYALNVSRDGYLFFSENFNLSGTSTADNPFIRDVPMKPLKVGESVVLKNVFFETDRYDLKEESEAELRKLTDFLIKNPTLRIEIGGHTDNTGSDSYNQALSENRAKAVYDHLAGQGISISRLSFRGYGKNQPVDTNDTEDGKARNRRTEFKVIE